MRKAGGVPQAVLITFAFLLLAHAAYPEISVASGLDTPAAAVALADGSAKTDEAAREAALGHKELGDGFRAGGDLTQAAEEYDKALSLYDGFPLEDRLMMARFLSWGGKLDEAIRELEKILSKEPDNLLARIYLASSLSWKGDQAASLEESSKALAASPGDREALLVRANALRRSGDHEGSISIYKEILEKEDDFDARLGLSQVYLVDGHLREAQEEAALLKPNYPYQEKELANLRADIDKATRPEASAGGNNLEPAMPSGVSASAAKKVDAAQEAAFRHKELGDGFRVGDDVKRAAEEYDKALSLYDGFPLEDRLMMARFLSWGGKLDEAIREFRKILSEEPDNLAARVHLARCLSWKGDQEASLEESSKVLAASPENKDALLVRANALRWSGKPKAGVSIYKDILEKGEDFDTRLGLSQVYLSDGYLRGTLKEAALLKPEYPSQEKELANLRVDIDKATRPDAGAGYGYYSDSDNNRAHRYNVHGGFWTGYWRWVADYLYTDASGTSYNGQSHRATISADSRPLEWLWVGGTAGYNRLEGDSTSGNFFSGSVRAGTNVYDGRLNLNVSRNVMTDIAELIEKQIRNTEIAANISYPLPYRFSLFAGYAYRDYSDNNHASDLYGMIRHRLGLKNPAISAGYRFRYLDFQRQSRGGYFDPSNYLSHRLDVTVDYEIEKIYAFLCLYGGHQSFNRYGESSNSFFSGWIAVLGMHVTNSVSVEIHGDGSNEVGGSTSGFRYNNVGARVRVKF